MAVLVTGGAGYIGSHISVELLNIGKDIIIVDNFCNSSPKVIDKIKRITGKDFKFYEIDLIEEEKLEKVFMVNNIDSIIHLAGLKAVGESTEKPIKYYYNNLTSTLVLLKTMKKYNCKKIVFSSSATVYGAQKELPIKETASLSTTNPYGTTKLMIERILRDVYQSQTDLRIVILRYFNPIGAHESGIIGEEPDGIPNNLMPYIISVARGNLSILKVYGDDYQTKDGTGVRDYIHVVDLAKGHIKALEKIDKDEGLFIYNLGTGMGYSVLDVIKTFERVNNLKLNYKIVDRRPGDIAMCYADASKALEELQWKAEKTLEDMCRDSWNFAMKQ